MSLRFEQVQLCFHLSASFASSALSVWLMLFVVFFSASLPLPVLSHVPCAVVPPCCFPREAGEDEGAHQFCCAASGCSSPSSRWAEVWLAAQRLTRPFTCEKTHSLCCPMETSLCTKRWNKNRLFKEFQNSKEQRCMQLVVHFTSSESSLCRLSAFFNVRFVPCRQIKLSQHIIVPSLLSHLSWIH